MKIRGLLAGVLVAMVISGCTSSATAPEVPQPSAAFDESQTTPPDTTNRGAGGMGSGN